MESRTSVTVPFLEPHKFCRLCLSNIGLSELFPSQEQNSITNKTALELAEKIYECTNIKLSTQTDANCAICRTCLRTVKDFYRFRVRTHEVNELLKKKAVNTSTAQNHCSTCSAVFLNARSLKLHQEMGCGASIPSTFTPVVEPTSMPTGGGGTITVTKENSSSITRNDKQANTSNEEQNNKSQQPWKRSNNYKYPKPSFSYPSLTALAMKNSHTGLLEVGEIYGFISKHFPYYRTAKRGWKNSIRHVLSTNDCFEKSGNTRKGFRWRMKPSKIARLEETLKNWTDKYLSAIQRTMEHPDNLDALLRGDMKHGMVGPDGMFVELYRDSDGSEFEANEVDEGDGEVVDLDDTEEEQQDEEMHDDDVGLISEPQTLEFGNEKYVIMTLDSLTAAKNELQNQHSDQAAQEEVYEGLTKKEEVDDDEVLVLPKPVKIRLDPECSIIKTPELLIDGEKRPNSQEFNLVVPDKRLSYRQPPAKRLIDDGSAPVVSFHEHFEKLQRLKFRNRQPSTNDSKRRLK